MKKCELLVEDVIKNSIADELKIKKGDRILSINNTIPKDIIEYRYGLNGKKELTQKEVATLMGISQSYISRIEKKVIKNLKSITKV